jgi:DNA repair protein RadA/Sms
MARPRTVFVCQHCGAQQPRWLGRCPDCGEWNAMVEERQAAEPRGGGRAGVERGRPEPITALAAASEGRRTTGIGELDRVLGGGLVPGAVILIGGDPGIGKSTLVLQALAALAHRGRALYVSGEESPQQVKMRADRLGITTAALLVLAETQLDAILEQARAVDPVVLAVDSIQTVCSEQLGSAAGSIGQVRESAAQLVQFAKRHGLATVLVGHVTKDGAFAGPRVLEHMVDTVLYFEGDRGHAFRILRAVKNRFGSTNEIGVFEMAEQGLAEVANPSGFFLAERPKGAAGSVIVASLEGTRPLLLEVQALVTPASFGTPRRTVLGADYNRVCLLLAVLEKRVGFPLQSQDAFVNVAGGGRVSEPAADLGLALAAASSYLDRPLRGDVVVMGEVGLTGEVRAVTALAARLKEAAALGFHAAVVPQNNLRGRADHPIEIQGVGSVEEAVRTLLGP